MKKTMLLVLTAISLCLSGCKSEAPKEDVRLIWDNGKYCAFPSIVKFQDRYYVSFREGESHIFNSQGIADGTTRILSSKDGETWEDVALLTKEGYDLRDPKLSVTADGRLMAIIGGSVYEGKTLVRRIPQVSFSSDGKTFSDPHPVVFDENITDDQEWIWRVTWHEGVGYAVTYGEHFALLKTTDGLHYSMICELDVPSESFPNETTVRFLPDGRMAMMVRREKADCMAWWGLSEAPFTEWKWKPLEFRVGGPEFIVLPDTSILAGTRSYYLKSSPKTILLKGDIDGRFEEIRLMPSYSDSSYPGFLIEGDELWMVYYSSHELKRANGLPRAGIYFTKIPLSEL